MVGGVVGDGVFVDGRVGGMLGNYNFPRSSNKMKFFNQISTSI